MNTEERRPIDDSLSSMPTKLFGERLDCLQEESGLTWRKLAASAGIAQREAIPLRRVKRFQPEPGHRGIVALARDLPGGCGLGTGGSYACDQTGNPDHHGHGG